MKAISIKQPWLYLITDMDKRIENRSWKPPGHIIGQRIALHASKKTDRIEYAAASRIARKSLELVNIAVPFPLGAIVATAVLSGWVHEDGTRSGLTIDARQVISDKYFSGPYGWVLTDIQKLPYPITYKGALGFWTAPNLT